MKITDRTPTRPQTETERNLPPKVRAELEAVRRKMARLTPSGRGAMIAEEEAQMAREAQKEAA